MGVLITTTMAFLLQPRSPLHLLLLLIIIIIIITVINNNNNKQNHDNDYDFTELRLYVRFLTPRSSF